MKSQFMLLLIFGYYLVTAWIVQWQELNSSDFETFQYQNWKTTVTTSEVKILQLCDKIIIAPDDSEEVEKDFSLNSQDVTQVRIEVELYFYTFTDSEVTIRINGDVILQQEVKESEITLFPNLCADLTGTYYYMLLDIVADVQIQQDNQFSITSRQLIINSNSVFGFKNVIFSTDGIQMDCQLNTPIMSLLSTCTSTCEDQYQQLQLPFMNNCQYQNNINVKKLKIYPDSLVQAVSYDIAENIWQIIPGQSVTSNIIYLDTFPFKILGVKLQLQGIIYLIGDWQDGSYLRFQLNYTLINSNISISIPSQDPKVTVDLKYQNYDKYFNKQQIITTISCDSGICSKNQLNMTEYHYEFITINRTNNKYYINPTNLYDVYDTQLILSNGTRIPVVKVILNSEATIALAHDSLTFGIQQNINGQNAQYAFQNKIYIYQSSKVSVCSSQVQGNCFQCSWPYYSHLGKCVKNCPIHSQISETNRNCTDFINLESGQYTPGIEQNSSGVYLIKEFYDSTFKTSRIEHIFDLYPNNDNFYTGQKYSNLDFGKIIGGYSTWGYGSFVKTFKNLPYHYQIRIYCRIFLIDGWDEKDTFTLSIDDTNYAYTNYGLSSSNLQGKKDLDSFIDVKLKQQHFDELLTIKFTCLSVNEYNDSREKSCGLSNLFVLYDRNVNYLCPQKNEFYLQYTQNCFPCAISQSNGCIQIQSLYFYKCDYHCFTCASSPNNCLSCDPALRRQLDLEKNQCFCKDGYYEVPNDPQCKKCPLSCPTCNKDQCLSCEINRILIDGKCECDSGYIEINNICTIQCHYSCQTCNTPNICESCDIILYRIKSDNLCVCIENYYESNNQQCLRKCDPKCNSCDDQGNCESCKNEESQILNNGVCICREGYDNVQLQNCSPICHFSCLTCSKPNSQNSCILCSSDAHRVNQQGNCICENGYIDEGNSICNKSFICHSTCLTCYGELKSNCITCDAEINKRELYENSCRCQDGYLENEQQSCRSIENCHFTCSLCLAPQDESLCVNCQPSRTFNEQHKCICVIGYVEVEKQCVKAATSNPTELQECDDGNSEPRDGCQNYQVENYWFCSKQTQTKNSVCKRCSDNCISCNDKNQCFLCENNYFLINGECTLCAPQCKTCSTNKYNCLQCSDSSQPLTNSNCQSCSHGYMLINESCQTICGDAIVAGLESCDDGNSIDLDGCDKNCQTEHQYTCHGSTCSLQPEPKKHSTYLKNSILLELEYLNSKCEYITIWIEEMQLGMYIYNVTEIELSQNTTLQCSINLTYLQNIDTYNTIHIIIQRNSRLLIESPIEVLVQPTKQYYFSSEEEQYSEIFGSLYELLIYLCFGLVPITIIFSRFQDLHLDFVFFNSFLYYFDIDMSLNLQQLFVIQPLALIPVFKYPFTITKNTRLSDKRNIIRQENEQIIFNLWQSFIVITFFWILMKTSQQIKQNFQKKLTTQIRPITSKNTKITSFTFRDENLNKSIPQINHLDDVKKLQQLQIYLIKVYYQLINILEINITFSIASYFLKFKITPYITIEDLLNIIVMVFVIMFQSIIVYRCYLYSYFQNRTFRYYYLSTMNKICMSFVIILLQEKPLFSTSLCFSMQICTTIYLSFQHKSFKYQDIILALMLLGLAVISYQQRINVFIEFLVIGAMFSFPIINIIEVIYYIIRDQI